MNRKYRDLIVITTLIVLGGFLLWMDMANVVVMQSFAIGLFLVAGTHITRRVLFDKMDIQEIAKCGAKEPIGAAIVFAAILMFLVSVMWIGIAVLK